jgi:hypothetical protein
MREVAKALTPPGKKAAAERIAAPGHVDHRRWGRFYVKLLASVRDKRSVGPHSKHYDRSPRADQLGDD